MNSDTPLVYGGSGFDSFIECCVLDAIRTYVTKVGVHWQDPLFCRLGTTRAAFFYPFVSAKNWLDKLCAGVIQ